MVKKKNLKEYSYNLAFVGNESLKRKIFNKCHVIKICISKTTNIAS
jgi:hypothetical protein